MRRVFALPFACGAVLLLSACASNSIVPNSAHVDRAPMFSCTGCGGSGGSGSGTGGGDEGTGGSSGGGGTGHCMQARTPTPMLGCSNSGGGGGGGSTSVAKGGGTVPGGGEVQKAQGTCTPTNEQITVTVNVPPQYAGRTLTVCINGYNCNPVRNVPAGVGEYTFAIPLTSSPSEIGISQGYAEGPEGTGWVNSPGVPSCYN